MRAYQPRGSKRFHVGSKSAPRGACGSGPLDAWRDLGYEGPLGEETVLDFAARVEIATSLTLCGNCRRELEADVQLSAAAAARILRLNSTGHSLWRKACEMGAEALERGTLLLLVALLILSSCASAPPVRVTCVRSAATTYERPDTLYMTGSYALQRIECPGEYDRARTEVSMGDEDSTGQYLAWGMGSWLAFFLVVTAISLSTDEEPDE